MANALVQSKFTSSVSATSIVVTLPGASTAGNVLALLFALTNPASTLVSVIDNNGTSWTQGASNAGLAQAFAYYLVNAPATSSITITYTTAGAVDAYAAEYSGPNAFDTAAANSATSVGTTATTGNFTPFGAGGLIVAANFFASSAAGAGYNQERIDVGTAASDLLEDILSCAAGAQAATVTLAAPASTYAIAALVFRTISPLRADDPKLWRKTARQAAAEILFRKPATVSLQPEVPIYRPRARTRVAAEQSPIGDWQAFNRAPEEPATVPKAGVAARIADAVPGRPWQPYNFLADEPAASRARPYFRVSDVAPSGPWQAFNWTLDEPAARAPARNPRAPEQDVPRDPFALGAFSPEPMVKAPAFVGLRIEQFVPLPIATVVSTLLSWDDILSPPRRWRALLWDDLSTLRAPLPITIPICLHLDDAPLLTIAPSDTAALDLALGDSEILVLTLRDEACT